MVIRGSLLAVLAAALLAFVGGSASAASSDIRLGQIVVEARFLEISVINTGTTSLDSLVAGFPPGTVVTSISSPSATFCAVSNEKNGALCLYGNGWAPNTTKTLNLELTAPLAIGAKVVVCSGNSCVDLTVEGPCECSKIDVETELKFLGVTDRPINLWIDLDWKLRCTGGEGACAGEIEVLKPKRKTDILAVSKGRIGCKGNCDTIRGGSMRFRFKSKNDLHIDERGGERFSFLVRTACLVDGKRVGVRTQPMTIVFKPNGKVDKAKSDLDADGKPDNKRG